ncbi:hypothetical protein KP79_PYT07928 [Mizuhopecten yessoensis]|uniref:VWFA domain-containing protein n=2 Tax=Mizuhopecten yessoensis TaxID=6573 RepID=A0A210QHA3_MIZYE|nr:hypothetical protein KP79_PYT07928 [Mizuhopecten yessoensis]
MVFVLNGNTSISTENFQKQKEFVREVITNHSSPPGAVHVGIIVCSDSNITEIDFKISKKEILTSLESIKKPEPNPSENKKSDCIASLREAYSNRERHNTSRTALFVIGEEGRWNKEDTKLLKVETEEEGISLLIVGVGIQSFSVLNAIQAIVSDNRKFYVLSSYRGLKRLSAELTTGPCLPMSLEVSESVTPQPIIPVPLPSLTFNSKCRELSDGRSYIREIPFLGWQRLTCPESTRIDTNDCKCRIPTESVTRIPEVMSTDTIEISTPLPVPTSRISTTSTSLAVTTSQPTTSQSPPDQSVTVRTAITTKQAIITPITSSNLQGSIVVDRKGKVTPAHDLTTPSNQSNLEPKTKPNQIYVDSVTQPQQQTELISPRETSEKEMAKTTERPQSTSFVNPATPGTSTSGSDIDLIDLGKYLKNQPSTMTTKPSLSK